MDRDAQNLLDTVTDELRHNSEDMHRLTRRRRILERAATYLRTGKAAGLVEAELACELPQHSNLITLNRTTRRT